MSHKQSGPPKEFIEIIQKWHQFNGDEDIRTVIARLTQIIQKRQNLTDTNPLVVSLRAAETPSATPEARAVALWSVVPYLKASDQLYRTVSSERIWHLLMDQALNQGYLKTSDIARYSQGLPLPDAFLSSPTYQAQPNMPIRQRLRRLFGGTKSGNDLI